LKLGRVFEFESEARLWVNSNERSSSLVLRKWPSAGGG